jgi:hypothetical protein
MTDPAVPGEGRVEQAGIAKAAVAENGFIRPSIRVDRRDAKEQDGLSEARPINSAL